MNLIVDIGNTHIKLAVFNHKTITTLKRITSDALKTYMDACYEQYPIKNTIISNVSRLSENNRYKTTKSHSVHILSHRSRIPFKNCYTTPETLGTDRIALVVAATDMFPKKNALIIDAGSCITYDFLTADRSYLGGAISPGISMRYSALHTFTGNLPLLEPDNFYGLTGNSTTTSIHAGIWNGIILEIEGVIDQYKKKYEDLTVILTGGDAQFLSKRLKNGIFVDQNFLLKGLNVVLASNKN